MVLFSATAPYPRSAHRVSPPLFLEPGRETRKCAYIVFYQYSITALIFLLSLFYLCLNSDFSANTENQNQPDYLYKNYYSSSSASLWLLSSEKIDRYSELRGGNKKAPIPKGRGFVLKVILLILLLSDVVWLLEYLAMQKQFRVVFFVFA